MKNSAKDMLSDWMRPIEVSANPEANGHREKVIKKLCSSKDKSLWLNLLRTALGLPSELKDADFIQHFKKQDESVPLTNNEHLIKILAGVTICFKLEGGDTDINHWLALAIINSCLVSSSNPESHIPLFDYALENVEQISIESRDVNMSELHDKVAELKDEKEGEETPTRDIVIELYNVNLRLLEETNILWWLYTGYSKVANSLVQNIEPTVAPLYAALELHSLMQVQRVISNSQHFFGKILGDAMQTDSSLYACINGLKDEQKEAISSKLTSAPNEFTPLSKALLHAKGFGEGDDWSGSFKKQFHGDAKKTVKNIDLANQFYRELLFLSLNED